MFFLLKYTIEFFEKEEGSSLLMSLLQYFTFSEQNLIKYSSQAIRALVHSNPSSTYFFVFLKSFSFLKSPSSFKEFFKVLKFFLPENFEKIYQFIQHNLSNNNAYIQALVLDFISFLADENEEIIQDLIESSNIVFNNLIQMKNQELLMFLSHYSVSILRNRLSLNKFKLLFDEIQASKNDLKTKLNISLNCSLLIEENIFPFPEVLKEFLFSVFQSENIEMISRTLSIFFKIKKENFN